jgi:hypothetical protein
LKWLIIFFLSSWLLTVSFVNSSSVFSRSRSSSAFLDRRCDLLWIPFSRNLLAEALLATFVQSQHLGSHIHICGWALVMHFVRGRYILFGAAMFVGITD